MFQMREAATGNALVVTIGKGGYWGVGF